MAELIFKYGTMNSGKSVEILTTAHNYEEKYKNVMLFTTSLDDRYGKGKISTRLGMSKDAIIVDENMMDKVEIEMPDLIIVDEAQFLKKENVEDLALIVDQFEITVIAYGLRSDFMGECDGDFEGAKYLFTMADRIEELESVCFQCNNKATHQMRFDKDNGNPVFNGVQVKIGGNDTYLPVCRKCYKREEFVYKASKLTI